MDSTIIRYPRTPHLFRDRSDEKSMNEFDSIEFIRNPNLIVEEKMDGTCIGIFFEKDKMCFQSRGEKITNHPQYDLFKTWAFSKREDFRDILQDTFIMFGEWLYLVHSINYTKLPHYFMEFDIYDKEDDKFLDTLTRRDVCCGAIEQVSVLHRGSIHNEIELKLLMGRSLFGNTMSEGLYLKIEKNGFVEARAKYVRPDFIKNIITTKHWLKKPMTYNGLRKNINIWK